VSVALPQTGDKGKATMIFSSDGKGRIELMDFTRNQTIEEENLTQANEGENK
jgi:DNA topoisomerase-3